MQHIRTFTPLHMYAKPLSLALSLSLARSRVLSLSQVLTNVALIDLGLLQRNLGSVTVQVRHVPRPNTHPCPKHYYPPGLDAIVRRPSPHAIYLI